MEENMVPDKRVITVIAKDGTEREAEILSIFNIKRFNKDYILYTFGEKDENDMVKIYASTLIKKDGIYSFDSIDEQEEWDAVKEIMREIAKSEED